MTTHYSVDSLTKLFLSDSFTSEKNNHKSNDIVNVVNFLNSIETNKQYYRTGILVKNPKYKKKVSEDTIIIKEFKTSLNKLSSLNYKKICPGIVQQLKDKIYLYPLIIETIIEYSMTHHTYSKYYCYLITLLHKQFNNYKLIEEKLEKFYTSIQDNSLDSSTQYSLLCSTNKKTDQLIGYCMLLHELEINNIVSNKIHPLLDTLIKNMNTNLSEDDMYKSVLCLYTLCNQMYGTKSLPENYLKEIELLKKTKFMKVKFKLMDIIERR